MAPPKTAKSAGPKIDQYLRQEKDPPGQDGGATRTDETAASADMAKVLLAITSCQEAVATCQATLTTKIEEVKVDVSLVRQDIQKLRERVTVAGVRLGTVEDSLPPPPPTLLGSHAAAD